jgi:hypothetical protein
LARLLPLCIGPVPGSEFRRANPKTLLKKRECKKERKKYVILPPTAGKHK